MAAVGERDECANNDRVAPFVPSPMLVVQRMLELARVGPGDKVFDLGSGDGRTVIMAAEMFGADATGVELDDELFKQSSARIARLALYRKARILHESMFKTDVRRATVVTLYQLPEVNARLGELLKRQLLPGTRVVSHDFPVPGWEHQKLVTGVLEDGSPHAIYLYHVEDWKEGTMPITVDNRGYVAGKYGLELDGQLVGYVSSVEGGHATSDVISEKVGSDHIVHKHIAGVKYEDITINCGTGMSKGFYQWVKDSFAGAYSRRNGAIVVSDFNYKQVSRLEFTNALVAEIGLPALDAGSKDAAKMIIKFTPQSTHFQSGSSASGTSSKYGGEASQKKWLPSNFRLRIDGLDCTRVNKIEALTVKQKVVENPVGELRDYRVEPAYLEVPNLVVTLPESNAKEFYDWHEEFVIKGNNGADKEKNGTLEYLTPDLKQAIFTLEFKHLGIFRLAPERVEAGSENIRRVKAEMYCQEMSFNYGSGIAADTGIQQVSTATSMGRDTENLPAGVQAEQAPRGSPSLRFRS